MRLQAKYPIPHPRQPMHPKPVRLRQFYVPGSVEPGKIVHLYVGRPGGRYYRVGRHGELRRLSNEG